MKISVGAIVYKNGKYLLQKRDNANNIFFPNFWGVFGGSVDARENERTAIIRELKEEINLDMIIKKKIITNFFESKYFKKKRKRVYFQCYFKKPQLQKIYLKEGSAFRYFKFEEIRKLKMVPWDLHAIYYFQLFYVNKQKNLLKLST